MAVVYFARDSGTAELVRRMLEDAGIAAAVEGASLTGLAGEVPFFAVQARVVVPDESVGEARKLLAEHHLVDTADRCEACGYLLTGLPLPRCPECGREFAVPVPVPSPWRCPNCQEEIEGTFTSCWNCETDRPEFATGDPAAE